MTNAQNPIKQYNAIVQDNVLFMVSILHIRKACFSGPELLVKTIGTIGKNCSRPYTKMKTATGWVQLETAV